MTNEMNPEDFFASLADIFQEAETITATGSGQKIRLNIIVDNSASMAHQQPEVQQGLQSLASMIKNYTHRNIEVVYQTFSSKPIFMTVANNINFPPYRPDRGDTPLYDTIKESLNSPKFTIDPGTQVINYIITDGADNVSKTTQHEIQELVNQLEATGDYHFLYSGLSGGGEYGAKAMGIKKGKGQLGSSSAGQAWAKTIDSIQQFLDGKITGDKFY